MSNQTMLSSLFILSWLSLLFMNKADIKRFLPVGLFATVMSAMILEAGITLGWWVYPVKLYPFQNIPYLYGPIPVSTMWIFKYTYGKFWMYIILDFILNLFYTFAFEEYFLGNRGVMQFQSVSPLLDVFITSVLGIAVYAYQIWQEDLFVRPETAHSSRSFNWQPALKPSNNDEDTDK